MKTRQINYVLTVIVVTVLSVLSGCNAIVSSHADFYVAVQGSDNNPGTKDKPFATIQRARDSVKGKLNDGLEKDVLVLIHGGTYAIDKTISFNHNDSGTNGFRVIYKNYPGERPIFSSGKKITGWQRVPGTNKWKAKLVGVDNTRELYVDGVLAHRARGKKTPAGQWKAADDPHMEKYNHLETLTTYQGQLKVYEGYKTTSHYADMVKWRNKSDIEFVYEQGWTYVICPVDSIVPTSDGGVFIKMRNPCFRDSQIKPGMHVGDPSYIQNAFELLDEPGEWYFDRNAKELYYIPLPNQNMQNTEVIVPCVETLLEVKGTLDNPVSDITFEGLEFSYGTFLAPSETGFSEIQATFTKNPLIDDNGHSHYVKTSSSILLDAAKSIIFERCGFSRFGGAGINIHNGSEGNIIRGCRLTEIGGSGIQIGGFDIDDAHPEDSRKQTKNNVVNNCYLNKIATIYKGGVGIISGYTEGTAITHNDISEVGYSGISIGWGWGYWDEGGRPNSKKNPAPANYTIFDKPTVSRRNRVENNYVYKVVQKLHDGGGVYTLSMMEDSVVKGNLIHDNGGWPGGIYMDEASGGIEVYENVIYHVRKCFNYHEVGLPGRRDTCNVHDNYDDIKPGEPGYPTRIAQKAGLEPKYKDIKY
ncbi:MAG: right-handed parallel beta-helix repeat-containing protein [Planctomycetota bacterium]